MIIDKLLGHYLHRVARDNLAFEPVTSSTSLPRPDAGKRYLLYLHIPFCVVLCPFCSFHRVRFQRDRAEHYFYALEQEIALAAKAGFRFSEVYFGGGTPTVLPKQLAALVRRLREHYGVTRVSAETNPDDLGSQTLDTIDNCGINRLSVGVQSFDDKLLRQMERYEKYGSGEQISARLKEVTGRFDTLNIDMMFNFPKQSADSLQRDLEILTGEVSADQVSWYPLMSAESTQKAMDKDIGRVDYTRERAFYRQIVDHMFANGYHRSSAWCFSRGPAMIDEYITDSDEYLGLGSGSFSYINGALYGSTFSINKYLRRIENGKPGVTRRSEMKTREQMRYYLLMKLFGGSLSLAAASERFGRSFGRALLPELAGLRLFGAVRRQGDKLVLTESGQYFWVMMMREFFGSVNDFRERMRLQISEERD
ncbi:MAG: coproporphyrinogen III oxidase family protein [Gammaproteobacteria bacterium]|nr:coproporphyrinogen III oxidase family protein [Gammaproteobacteria bacterium]